MWPVTVRVELALSSQRTMGLLERTFSDACGCRSRGCPARDSSVRCAGRRGEGSSGVCALPELDGFPHAAAKRSRELQCSTGKAAPARVRASTGKTQLRVTRLTYTQLTWHPSRFSPCAGHFRPYRGGLKYCHPDVLNVLILPWGVRCCKPGWTASASQKGGS